MEGSAGETARPDRGTDGCTEGGGGWVASPLRRRYLRMYPASRNGG